MYLILSCSVRFSRVLSQVDIEGAELLALEEASTTLTENVDQILLEVHMHLSDHAHDSAKPEHFEEVRIT